jgi:hypothetical protein
MALPSDLEPEELDEMIRGLGLEMGCPVDVHPDLIGPDPDNHSYWAKRHKQSVEWRRKLIRELGKRPRWIAEWRC